jgi:CRP-like cAMP-binding protein
MTNINEEVALLRRIPLFANIEAVKLKLLAFTSRRLTYEANQILFHQGAEGDAAYVIIDGTADILVDTPQGRVSIAKAERNAIVGEIAILCDVPRTATVQALTRLETLRIDKQQFLKLIQEFPELAIEMLKVLGLRLMHTNLQLTEARKRATAEAEVEIPQH